MVRVSKDLAPQLRQRFSQAEQILIASHTRPDGDAVGSVLGLGQALQAQGKQVVMALADGVPSALKFLPGSEQIVKKVAGDFDLVIVVDCSNLERIGNLLYDGQQVDLNIDHHPDNKKFGIINLVEPASASTTEILAGHFPAFGLPFTRPVLDNLLAGLITDTQGFKTVSTRPETLRVAADLFEKGAALPELYFNALNRKTFEAARYWGAGLSHLDRDGLLVWAVLTIQDRAAANYNGRDDADLVNMISSIDGAKVSVIFIQQDQKSVKVSWRTRAGLDVSAVAHQFGGGGHKAAAGAMIAGNLPEVQAKVLEATKAIIQNKID